MMLGYLALVFGAVLSAVLVYLLWVSFGFCKTNCSVCKGYLKRTTQHKDHYVRRQFYKRYIDFVYEYRVDGKTYVVSGGAPGTKSNLKDCADIVFQKKNPRRAYVHGLTFPIQPIAAALLFLPCVGLLVSGICMVV